VPEWGWRLVSVGLCPGGGRGQGLEGGDGSELVQDAGAASHVQGRGVQVGETDTDVAVSEVADQFDQVLGAGDVEIVVGVEVENHRVHGWRRVGDEGFDAVLDGLGVDVEEGPSGRRTSTPGMGWASGWRWRSRVLARVRRTPSVRR
jgi:hypothetical protein